MKEKLATSWEIYNQIMWNPKLNAQAFTVGFADRMAKSGIREKPLLEWANESDIPWHRIRYYRCGELVVWDRGRRLDLFAEKRLPSEAWVAEINPVVATKVNTDFSLRAVYCCHQDQWQVYTGAVTNQTLAQLKVISYNVLCDEHDKEYVRSKERYVAIAQHLAHLEADIIALQEATPLLIEFLRQQAWAKDYFFSEPPNSPTLRPFGQVILSKYPFSLVEHLYSPQKRFLVAGWQINGEAFHVANVHLTSNHSDKAMGVRQQQLEVMTNYLKSLRGDVLLVGDFNMREGENVDILTEHQFEDVWPLQHPDDAGFSFHPDENPLAERFSRSGLPGRFDRMYLRSQSLQWLPQHIKLFAKAPIAQDYLRASDHYGVFAVYDFADMLPLPQAVPNEVLKQLQTVQPTYQSAIVLIPPNEIHAPIQKIRKQYDQKLERWMPHITLMYGFIPKELFEAALPLLETALQQLAPFEIVLQDFRYFEHRKSTTGWLRPIAQPTDALQRLQDILQPLFPQCNEQTIRASGFTPHLSIGQFASPEEAQKCLPAWNPLRFKVEKIALISRDKDTPFEVKYQVFLGKEQVKKPNKSLIDWVNDQAPLQTTQTQLKRQAALAQVQQVCSEVLNQSVHLQVFGSELLKIAQAHSDIDVLCPLPPSLALDPFFDQLQTALSQVAQGVHLVTDARVTTLKFNLQGVNFDLLAVHHPSFPVPLHQVKPEAFQQFDPLSWQNMVGYLEGQKILALGNKVGQTLFRDLVRTIRLWAARKQLTGNVFGFFGNISWAILAAWSCAHCQTKHTPTLEHLLQNFFDLLAQHSWVIPIGLQEGTSSYIVRKHRDWMPVVSAFYPYKNTTRNLTQSTAKVIQGEIQKARLLLQNTSINWLTFFAATDVQKEYTQLLILELSASNEQNLELAQGKLLGSLLGVILALEQQVKALVRPSTIIKKAENGLSFQLRLGLHLPADSSQKSLNEFVGKFDHEYNTKLKVYLEG
ncbi:poly(A) polymerase [Microscilla marina]|uniref:Endonuclease/exonuclease/phosphatase family n=1 Tax=Microscilla marina ATCC 23134 TaxID=313606 RepID=A1ZFL1_MICM2|nr:poly(A) polymerase [Microscilla marina]EAY30785.1 endonuclease/exonuclease/phosphatase family [Microscilla marina ATCC 23134]